MFETFLQHKWLWLWVILDSKSATAWSLQYVHTGELQLSAIALIVITTSIITSQTIYMINLYNVLPKIYANLSPVLGIFRHLSTNIFGWISNHTQYTKSIGGIFADIYKQFQNEIKPGLDFIYTHRFFTLLLFKFAYLNVFIPILLSQHDKQHKNNKALQFFVYQSIGTILWFSIISSISRLVSQTVQTILPNTAYAKFFIILGTIVVMNCMFKAAQLIWATK